jgi:mannobiose 2-epimerase
MDFAGKQKGEIAKELEIYLREKVMPYWYGTAIDATNGGYILADELYPSRKVGTTWRTWFCLLLSNYSQKRSARAKEKQLVSQCRMLLVFSLVHRLGYSGGNRNYLKAAEIGYRFLIESMLDRQHSGFYWRTDLEGRVLDSGKSLYGQAFALYALVEYHRASGLSGPLDQAFAIYQKVQEKFHDGINSGWIEHGEQNFMPLTSLSSQSLWTTMDMPGVIGLKSSNAHLHWMEALIELYNVTFAASVKTSLTEVLHINKTFFFPAKPAKSCDYRTADWSEVRDNHYDGMSYGHTIEFAWLMIQAQKVLKVTLDWDHFDNILMHALKYGFDHKKGGFYWRGFNEQPASDTTKVWWVQAEGLAALTEAIHHNANVDYDRALDLLLSWIFKYQILSNDGIWIASTTKDGKPLDFTKAGSWKAAYHEVRSIIKFIHMFSPSGSNYVS